MSIRECPWCGIGFESVYQKKLVCSKTCYDAKFRYDRKLSGKTKILDKQCFVCGEMFKAKMRPNGAKTCSLTCSEQLKNDYYQTEHAKRLMKIRNERRIRLMKDSAELLDNHRARNRMTYSNNREKWVKYYREKQSKVRAVASAMGRILDMKVTNYNKYTLYMAYRQLTGEK